MKKNVLWITQTAVCMALVIVVQAATAGFGNTLITGSAVNLILIVSVMLFGLKTGFTVAALSPVFARLMGIGPLWTLIPFIMLGNATIVIVWHYIGNLARLNRVAAFALALAAGAAAKFAVLYTGVVRVAVPFLLNLPEKQAAAISATFSVSQLITAAVGGALAAAVLPVLYRAVKKQ